MGRQAHQQCTSSARGWLGKEAAARVSGRAGGSAEHPPAELASHPTPAAAWSCCRLVLLPGDRARPASLKEGKPAKSMLMEAFSEAKAR